MISFIISNIATILVGLVVFTIIALIVVKMVRNKKKGISSCGCNCKNCPMSNTCHK